MSRFYCVCSQKIGWEGDICEDFISNNKFVAEDFLKNVKLKLSSYDLKHSRFWIDVYEADTGSSDEVVDFFERFINIGFEFYRGCFDWDLFLDNFSIVDVIL